MPIFTVLARRNYSTYLQYYLYSKKMYKFQSNHFVYKNVMNINRRFHSAAYLCVCHTSSVIFCPLIGFFHLRFFSFLLLIFGQLAQKCKQPVQNSSPVDGSWIANWSVQRLNRFDNWQKNKKKTMSINNKNNNKTINKK